MLTMFAFMDFAACGNKTDAMRLVPQSHAAGPTRPAKRLVNSVTAELVLPRKQLSDYGSHPFFGALDYVGL